MKKRTTDRVSFYTVEALGKSREITPEGFLLCKSVAIARTGQQLYTTAEIPLDDAGNGEIRIDRLPDEVFRDETLASFEGKPVTVEHPAEFVSPDNWNRLAVGTVQNVRRGEGLEDDLLMADLLITSADAIEYVNRELPELSAGYEADYEQTEPGRGVQRNIIGNHVALVERGRAGPRCSIQDHQPKEKTMKKRSFWDRLMTAVKAQDADAVKAELESQDSEEELTEEEKAEKEKAKTGDAIAKLTATVDALAAKVEKLTKDAKSEEEKTEDEDEESDEEKETEDTIIDPETAEKADTGSTYTGDALKAIIARAEILAPGIAVPTGDAIKSKDAAPKLMKKALETAYATEHGKDVITPFLMGRELSALTGDALAGVFSGAAELARVRNNDKIARNGISTQDFGRAASVSDINARNKAFWANRSA